MLNLLCYNKETRQIDWDKLCKTIPEFEKMKSCKQRPKYHKEGSVFEHTKMCFEWYIKQNMKKVFDDVIIPAILLHDIGKTMCPVDEEGYVLSNGHEKLSESWCKQKLINYPLAHRTKVITLIKYHDLRYKYRNLNEEKLISYLREIGETCGNHLLYVLFKSDFYGSIRSEEINENVETDIENINNYFNKPLLTLLFGLPGSGKNYFIENYLLKENPESVVISRDDIREKLKIKGCGTKEEEEKVTKIFNDLFFKALKERKNIVINNTNLKYKYRQFFWQQAKLYNYDTELICIDRDIEEIKKVRPGDNWNEVINRMIDTMDFPRHYEADYIHYFNEKITNDMIKNL